MTNEEAIEFGNMWLEINEDSKDSNTYEFFQMAIKALEQQSTLDKIRAEIIELRSKQNVGVMECLDIIDKYKESEG